MAAGAGELLHWASSVGTEVEEVIRRVCMETRES